VTDQKRIKTKEDKANYNGFSARFLVVLVDGEQTSIILILPSHQTESLSLICSQY